MGKNSGPITLGDQTGQYNPFQDPPSCLPHAGQLWRPQKISPASAENTGPILQQARGQRIAIAFKRSCHRPLPARSRPMANRTPLPPVHRRNLPPQITFTFFTHFTSNLFWVKKSDAFCHPCAMHSALCAITHFSSKLFWVIFAVSAITLFIPCLPITIHPHFLPISAQSCFG